MPIEDIEDKDVDNLAVVDLSGGRRNPMEGGGGGVGGAIASLHLKLLGKGSRGKKRFLSGIARMMGGGVYPCPNFLALFLEVHFWSIKRVYFFKNANVLNF